MSYGLSGSSDAPATLSAFTIVGIIISPTIDNQISPFSGQASVQVSASFEMMAAASCNFIGNANSEGTIGWIVQELDLNGNILRTVESNFGPVYDVAVNFGRSSKVDIRNPSYTDQTSFSTWPFRSYVVYVALSPEMDDQGNNSFPKGSSIAGGSGTIHVNSISWTWTVAAPL